MAIITAPAFRFASIDWAFERPAQRNVAALNKVATDANAPWFGKWSARAELKYEETEDAFRLLRSFLLRCNGPLNKFRIPASTEPQNANAGVTVSSLAPQNSTTLVLSGVSTPLTKGQFVTVNDQLLLLFQDQIGSTILFEPPLRAQATGGTAVETANPTVLVQLAKAPIGWTIEPPQRFRAGFDVEEAI